MNARNKTNESMWKRGLRWSAWGAYCLIVFEILFMVSPFALYYYSIYSVPLNWLQSNPATAWLTLYVLPHFTYTKSMISNVLLVSAWPLILLGLVMFVVGFVQIYWAKLTDKANVSRGLYRHIRHPQYVALAIMGLGTTIYWSRFFVVATYVSMIFLYYFLARYEEELCVAKFGRAYVDYQSRTGMFVPRNWFPWLQGLRTPKLLTGARWRRYAALGLLYVIVTGGSVGVSALLKHHVVGGMTVYDSDELTLVALAPTTVSTLSEVHTLAVGNPEYERIRSRYRDASLLGYVAPSSWTIPELGLVSREQGGPARSGLEELLHPSVHGNSFTFDDRRWTVLLTEPVIVRGGVAAQGRELLRWMMGYVPKLEMHVDVDADGAAMAHVSPRPSESGWSGIPVPVY